MADKSDLMALTFATRYRALPILAGMTVAAAIVHSLSAVVGAVLGAAILPDHRCRGDGVSRLRGLDAARRPA